jgi:hypothetical protein
LNNIVSCIEYYGDQQRLCSLKQFFLIFFIAFPPCVHDAILEVNVMQLEVEMLWETEAVSRSLSFV